MSLFAVGSVHFSGAVMIGSPMPRVSPKAPISPEAFIWPKGNRICGSHERFSDKPMACTYRRMPMSELSLASSETLWPFWYRSERSACW
ncbi:hypothetical protein D3C87_1505810 [compost metagenome]